MQLKQEREELKATEPELGAYSSLFRERFSAKTAARLAVMKITDLI